MSASPSSVKVRSSFSASVGVSGEIRPNGSESAPSSTVAPPDTSDSRAAGSDEASSVISLTDMPPQSTAIVSPALTVARYEVVKLPSSSRNASCCARPGAVTATESQVSSSLTAKCASDSQ